MKLKPLPPTLREKKRYLLLKGDKKKVEKAILDFLGVLGYAKAGPLFISQNNYLILSVAHNMLEEVRTALSLEGISPIGVSGTIAKLKAKFLSRAVLT